MTATCQLTVTFPFRSLIWLTAEFKRPPTDAEILDGTAANADDWQLVDPDTVSAKVKAPDDTITNHDWLGSPADITHDSTGKFHLAVTPDQEGEWFFRFESTGNGQAANEHHFKVAATEFP
jgi:autotransporter translocation and assembly factor TamB